MRCGCSSLSEDVRRLKLGCLRWKHKRLERERSAFVLACPSLPSEQLSAGGLPSADGLPLTEDWLVTDDLLSTRDSLSADDLWSAEGSLSDDDLPSAEDPVSAEDWPADEDRLSGDDLRHDEESAAARFAASLDRCRRSYLDAKVASRERCSQQLAMIDDDLVQLSRQLTQARWDREERARDFSLFYFLSCTSSVTPAMGTLARRSVYYPSAAHRMLRAEDRLAGIIALAYRRREYHVTYLAYISAQEEEVRRELADAAGRSSPPSWEEVQASFKAFNNRGRHEIDLMRDLRARCYPSASSDGAATAGEREPLHAPAAPDGVGLSAVEAVCPDASRCVDAWTLVDTDDDYDDDDYDEEVEEEFDKEELAGLQSLLYGDDEEWPYGGRESELLYGEDGESEFTEEDVASLRSLLMRGEDGDQLAGGWDRALRPANRPAGQRPRLGEGAWLYDEGAATPSSVSTGKQEAGAPTWDLDCRQARKFKFCLPPLSECMWFKPSVDGAAPALDGRTLQEDGGREEETTEPMEPGHAEAAPGVQDAGTAAAETSNDGGASHEAATSHNRDAELDHGDQRQAPVVCDAGSTTSEGPTTPAAATPVAVTPTAVTPAAGEANALRSLLPGLSVAEGSDKDRIARDIALRLAQRVRPGEAAASSDSQQPQQPSDAVVPSATDVEAQARTLLQDKSSGNHRVRLAAKRVIRQARGVLSAQQESELEEAKAQQGGSQAPEGGGEELPSIDELLRELEGEGEGKPTKRQLKRRREKEKKRLLQEQRAKRQQEEQAARGKKGGKKGGGKAGKQGQEHASDDLKVVGIS